MALFGVNHTLTQAVSEDVSYGDLIAAVDPNFATACTLFEDSAARHSGAAVATYIVLVQAAMDGSMPISTAVDRIMDLAHS